MFRTNKFVFVVMLLAVLTSSVVSQAIPSTPNQELRRQMENAARVERDIADRMRAMADLQEKMIAITKNDERNLNQAPQLSKKQRERVLSLRKIDPSDVERYSAFLSGDRTGIFKIFPDFNCVSENVVKIDGECSKFVPESSSFSFRTVKYTDRFYQDIGLLNGELSGGSFFAQGIFISLGDMPIANVGINTPQIATLLAVKPATNPAEAKATAASIARGEKLNEFDLLQKITPVENTTYAFRTIAYRFQNTLPPPREDSPITELRFHSLAFDKRIDALYVFRIVRKGIDGELTLVWKELSRQDAPKLKFPKGQPPADFK